MPSHPTLITVALLAHRGGTEFDCVLPSGPGVVNLNGDANDGIAALKRLAGTKIRPQITVAADQVAKVG